MGARVGLSVGGRQTKALYRCCSMHPADLKRIVFNRVTYKAYRGRWFTTRMKEGVKTGTRYLTF